MKINSNAGKQNNEKFSMKFEFFCEKTPFLASYSQVPNRWGFGIAGWVEQL